MLTLECIIEWKMIKYRFGAKLEIFERDSKSILSHGLTRFPLSWIVLSVLSCLKKGGTTIVLLSISAINIDSLKPLSWLFGPYVNTVKKDRKGFAPAMNNDLWLRRIFQPFTGTSSFVFFLLTFLNALQFGSVFGQFSASTKLLLEASFICWYFISNLSPESETLFEPEVSFVTPEVGMLFEWTGVAVVDV